MTRDELRCAMTDTERLDKLQRLLADDDGFANGIAFTPYISIQTNGQVLAVFKLTEAATVLSDEILSSQPSLRAAIDAL